jgi:hypothetical protein
MTGLFVRAVLDSSRIEIAALHLSMADGDEATRGLFWRNVIVLFGGTASNAPMMSRGSEVHWEQSCF